MKVVPTSLEEILIFRDADNHLITLDSDLLCVILGDAARNLYIYVLDDDE